MCKTLASSNRPRGVDAIVIAIRSNSSVSTMSLPAATAAASNAVKEVAARMPKAKGKSMFTCLCFLLFTAFRACAVAVIIGYCGTKYSGLQINTRFRTVEKTLVDAIQRCNGISKDNYDPNGDGNLSKVLPDALTALMLRVFIQVAACLSVCLHALTDWVFTSLPY